jgi:hypothetical protein
MIGQIELKQLWKKNHSVQAQNNIVPYIIWLHKNVCVVLLQREKLYGKNFHPGRGHMTSMNAGSKQKELINCLYYKYK